MANYFRMPTITIGGGTPGPNVNAAAPNMIGTNTIQQRYHWRKFFCYIATLSVTVTFLVIMFGIGWQVSKTVSEKESAALLAATVNLFFAANLPPMAPLAGEIIRQNNTTTTYLVGCSDSWPDVTYGICPFGNGMTMTAAPERVQYTNTPFCGWTQTVDCAIAATDAAACTFTEPPSFGASATTTVTSLYSGSIALPGAPTQAFQRYSVILSKPQTSALKPPPCLPTGVLADTKHNAAVGFGGSEAPLVLYGLALLAVLVGV